MNKMLTAQKKLQKTYAELGLALDPSTSAGWRTGALYDYISGMRFHLNEEIDELLLCLSNNDRSIHKPWSSKYHEYRQRVFVPSPETKSEAIDALCFMMNILLAAGVTPDNIENEYEKVYDKIRDRQEDPSY